MDKLAPPRLQNDGSSQHQLRRPEKDNSNTKKPFLYDDRNFAPLSYDYKFDPFRMGMPKSSQAPAAPNTSLGGMPPAPQNSDGSTSEEIYQINMQSSALQGWSAHYNAIAQEQPRSTNTIPDRMPTLESVNDMIARQAEIGGRLRRIQKNIIESQGTRGPGSYDEDMSMYGDAPHGFGVEGKKRQGKAAPLGRCLSCNRAETPEWRRGPDGARTLCNACGLHYAKANCKSAVKQSPVSDSLLSTQPKSRDLAGEKSPVCAAESTPVAFSPGFKAEYLDKFSAYGVPYSSNSRVDKRNRREDSEGASWDTFGAILAAGVEASSSPAIVVAPDPEEAIAFTDEPAHDELRRELGISVDRLRVNEKQEVLTETLTNFEVGQKKYKYCMLTDFADGDVRFMTIEDVHFGGKWFYREVSQLGRLKHFFPFLTTKLLFPMVLNSEPLYLEIGRNSIWSTYETGRDNDRSHPFLQVLYNFESMTDVSKAQHVRAITAEIDSDWEDDETDESEGSCESRASAFHDSQTLCVMGNSSIKSALISAKSNLIDRLMREFWIIFDRLQNTGIITQNSDSSSTEIRSAANNASISAGKCSMLPPRGTKRKLDNDKENDPGSDDDIQRRPGPGRNSSAASDVGRTPGNFACPYRKHKPRVYNIIEWRTCALTSYSTIARVKEHLYRNHRIFQCPRCKVLFTNQERLDDHFTTIEGCDLSSVEATEGITAGIEKRLRSRKKTSRYQTEEDRWRNIYQILFPGEEVPSPFFEPIQEEIALPPENRELANFQEYSRQELPVIFRRALEMAVNDKAQPIEEELRRELPNMVRTCLEHLFSSYAALKSGSRESVTPAPAPEAGNAPMNRPSAPLRTFVGFPSQPVSLQSNIEIPAGGAQSQCHAEQESLDSGYGSHESASSSSIGEDLTKINSNDSTAFDFRHQVSDERPDPSVLSIAATSSDDTSNSFRTGAASGTGAASVAPFQKEDMMTEDFDRFLMDQDLDNWNIYHEIEGGLEEDHEMAA